MEKKIKEICKCNSDYTVKKILHKEEDFLVFSIIYENKDCVLKMEKKNHMDCRNEVSILLNPILKDLEGVPKVLFAKQNIDKFIYISYPFGTSLDKIKLSYDNISILSLNLVKILKNLHGYGFVHGDVKDRNIIIDKNGEMCLIDFGKSCKIGEGITSIYSGKKIFINENDDILSACWTIAFLLEKNGYISINSEDFEKLKKIPLILEMWNSLIN